jgi:hypothetical protein
MRQIPGGRISSTASLRFQSSARWRPDYKVACEAYLKGPGPQPTQPVGQKAEENFLY